jgi:pimeloyl-ACP methyl ester carboxylesterase
VLPEIGASGRLLAPDLIGMGNSGKPDIPYHFDDHARYLDAWFEALELDSVVLVGHDWSGALAFDWAARHPGHTRGVAFMEAIIRPLSWDELLLTFEGTVSVGPEMIAWCAQHITSLEIENCGPAGHQAPHDRPEAIAAGITAWALRHGLLSS